MDEKLREPTNWLIQNSHAIKNQVHWTNTLSVVSTIID